MKMEVNMKRPSKPVSLLDVDRNSFKSNSDEGIPNLAEGQEDDGELQAPFLNSVRDE